MNASSLHQLLSTTLDLSKQLMACLDRENANLVARQYQQLIETAQQKQQLIEQLDRLDKQRLQIAGSSSFDEYLNTLGDITAQGYWSEIQDKVKSCAQKNDVNGRLLQRQHQITQETMGVLTGRGDSSNRVYDAKGKTSSQASLLPNIEA